LRQVGKRRDCEGNVIVVRDWVVELLQERIEELDDDQLPVVSFDADRRLLHFILVMTSYTNTTFAAGTGGQPVLSPADADELAGTCRLLADIAQGGASLVDGPLDGTRQQWIGTGRQTASPASVPTPARTQLIEADETNAASTKPFDLGLYTSTAAPDGRSMWRTYLDSTRGSTLHPLPWYTWNLKARDDTKIGEITSACAWVDFVDTYPHPHAGKVYPDWRNVAQDLDGVHLTLRAILAIQGFSFPTSHGLTAPTYWDVESTLWLRWCFTSVNLREMTDDG
jgi:hypothetical protein